MAYYETIGQPEFPLLADGGDLMPDRTPMRGNTHPEMCALSPELEILDCTSGHGGHQDMLDVIREHAGL